MTRVEHHVVSARSVPGCITVLADGALTVDIYDDASASVLCLGPGGERAYRHFSPVEFRALGFVQAFLFGERDPALRDTPDPVLAPR